MSIIDTYKEAQKLFKENKYQEANKRLNIILEKEPEHFEALRLRAKSRTKAGDFDLALEDWRTLITQRPEMADLHSEMGISLHMAGKNDDALKHFTHAVKLEPKNPYRYSSRAFVKSRIKDLPGAIADYERALELDPDDAVSLNNKGILEEQLGRKRKAKQSYAKADALQADQSEKKQDILSKNKNPKKRRASSPGDKNEQQTVSIKERVGLTKKEAQAPQKLTFAFFISTLKDVFLSKETRNEFLDFIKGLFGK